MHQLGSSAAVSALVALILASYISSSTAQRVAQRGPVWKPSEGSLEDWLRCHGMAPDICLRHQSLMRQLKQLISDKQNPPDMMQPNSLPISQPNAGDFGTCMLFTEEQLLGIIFSLNQNGTGFGKSPSGGSRRRRGKRSVTSFVLNPSAKWNMPIPYKFDGTFDVNQQRIVRSAFQHWVNNTCVRFTELSTTQVYAANHILLTKGGTGCSSWVGKVNHIPQQINLDDSCLNRFGTPVHEIGHALGSIHEQMRSDRDDTINVLSNNINPNYMSQFLKLNDTDNYNVHYDPGSVMQYSPADGAILYGLKTMTAKESFYQQNMGQRTGLSFADSKIINLAYCREVCKVPLAQPCQRGGYQNPNDCSQCMCPDGFSGSYCQLSAPAINVVNCGGTIKLGPGEQLIVKSPGYDTPQYYMSFQQCNWWLQAPPGQLLVLTFDGDFGLYCETGSCYHWVEVKYKADLGLPGGRFCCYQRPNVTVASESNEMMIIFKSNFAVDFFTAQRGFKAIVKTVNNPAPSTTASTTTATTTTVTTTRTTVTTTTLKTTTANSPTTILTTTVRPQTPAVATNLITPSTSLPPTPSIATTTVTLKPTPAIVVPLSPLPMTPSTVTTTTTLKPTPTSTLPSPASTLVPSSAISSTVTTTTLKPTTQPATTSAVTSSSTVARLDCNPFDVAFLIDSSADIDASDWQQLRAYIALSISTLRINVNRIHIGVVTYADTATSLLTLGGSHDLEGIISAFPLARIERGRNILSGLQVVRKDIFSGSTDRPNVPNVCIVIVTGGLTVPADKVIQELNQIKAASIRIIVIAIGSTILKNEAAMLAGSEADVIYARKFIELNSDTSPTSPIKLLFTKICDASSTLLLKPYLLFECSFEPDKSSDVFCGITQDKDDQFDWTVYHDPTPSDPTGPDFPYDQYFYIYIEASAPRQPNDEARLTFPSFGGYTGRACVDFYFHMFGFHINTLTLLQITSSGKTVLFTRSHDKGNIWYHGFADVNIVPNAQLKFVASRGQEYSGDIGLDKIQIVTGYCR